MTNAAHSQRGKTINTAKKNILIVNPDSKIEVGKVYTTINAAKTFALTKTPSLTNQWEIQGGPAENSEDIQMESWVDLRGFHLTGEITSNVTPGAILTGRFIDCKIDNAIGTSAKINIYSKCEVTGGTAAAGSVHVCIEQSVVSGGNFLAAANFQCKHGLVQGGTFPASAGTGFTHTEFVNIAPTFAGGNFENCIFGWAAVTPVLNAGTYNFTNCSMSMGAGVDFSAGTVNLYNCSAPSAGSVIEVSGTATLNSTRLTNVAINVTGGGTWVDNDLSIPILTTTERDALAATNGMRIYNSTLDKFQGREAGAWVSFI